MKKILSYFLVFLGGVLIGGLIWVYKFQNDNKPIYYESPIQNLNVTSDSTQSMPIQLVNSQDINESRRNVITKAVEMVSPAVIGINVIQIKSYRSPGMLFDDDPFFRYFFPQCQQLVKGLGSGFIISPDGHILTNEHVVHKAAKIIVTLPDGEKYDAELVASDYISDIAVLKIKSDKKFPYVIFGNSDDLIIGEWAVAFGNPFGLFDMGQPSVSQGIISATDRDFGKQSDERIYKDMIQTDAAINSGNSGGPLVNSLGEVIGMNTFIFSGSQRSGTSIGLGFAIPINRVKNIVKELRKYGSVDRTFTTGLSVVNLTRHFAAYLNIEQIKGVVVAGVEPNSPASRAGLQVGDVIVKINDYEITSTEKIEEVFDDLDVKAGDTLKLTVFRENEYFRTLLKLGKIR